MIPLLLALPVMTIAWFFNFQTDGRSSQRFGPYLTEATCEAVRAQVLARSHGGSSQTGASACFKVIVQENEQIAN